MPGKIKSAKQFRFLEAAAHGKLDVAGPSAATAEKMLSHESHATKSAFASENRKRKFTSAIRRPKV